MIASRTGSVTPPTTATRYSGTASRWGFALYYASSDRYEDSLLPTGGFAGSPEDALDCACQLHLVALDT
ncbi:hypothetical protein [Streptomyces sp. NPDC002758]